MPVLGFSNFGLKRHYSRKKGYTLFTSISEVKKMILMPRLPPKLRQLSLPMNSMRSGGSPRFMGVPPTKPQGGYTKKIRRPKQHHYSENSS